MCIKLLLTWLGGSMVRPLDSWPIDHVFNSRPVCYIVTAASCSHVRTCVGALGLLVGVDSQLSGFHPGSFASNFEQVANLLWDGKWVVAYWLCSEGLLWLIGVVVCLLAASRRSNCLLTRAVDGHMVRCSVISSCQFWSEVYSCKKRYSIYQTFTFNFTFTYNEQLCSRTRKSYL